MKTKLTTLLTLLALGTFLHADFKIKKGVYQIGDMEKLIEYATKKGKIISILYSDKDSSCPLCASASNHSMDTFSKKSLMMYVDKNTKKQLPEEVQAAFKNKEAGKYLPMTPIDSLIRVNLPANL